MIVKTQSQKTAAPKFKRLWYHFALDSAQRLLAKHSPFELGFALFVLLGVAYRLADSAQLAFAHQLGRIAIGYLVILGCAFLLTGVARKLGLIDAAFLKAKPASKPTRSGDFIYAHQKPETSLEDGVGPGHEGEEKPQPLFRTGLPSTSDWQTVEAEKFGKFRYHFVDHVASHDASGSSSKPSSGRCPDTGGSASKIKL